MKDLQWYKHNWSLDIKNESWTEDTENQVDFIIKTLDLKNNDKILDLACGYGRHSLALARRGYSVTGVDITKEFIDDAILNAKKESLNTIFINSDIRDLTFTNEFDVVLNLADGAIGYLENDEENLKIFDIAVKALKPNGKHFIDICNADHAETYFPKKSWEKGRNALSLSQFDWDSETRRMKFAGCDIPYNQPAESPQIDMDNADPIRLYSLSELDEIYNERGMKIIAAYSDYYSKKASNRELQLMVYSIKI